MYYINYDQTVDHGLLQMFPISKKVCRCLYEFYHKMRQGWQVLGIIYEILTSHHTNAGTMKLISEMLIAEFCT